MSLPRGMVRSWCAAVLVIAIAVPASAARRQKTTTTSTSTSSTSSTTTSTSRPSTTSTSSTTSPVPSTTSTTQPNTAPIANAGPDRSATTGVAITLDGSGSSDPGGYVAAYWWTFGDGGSTTTATPTVSHTYASAGTYVMTLWVRDNLGLWSLTSDSATVSVANSGGGTTSTTTSTSTSRPPTTTTSGTASTTTTTLQPNQAPVANAGPDQATQTLITLTFNGSGSYDPDGTIALASWNFGDGTTAPGLTATHSYASAGTYTATLSIIDNSGTLDTDTATITVANRPPVANAGPDASGQTNSPVGLNGTASSDPDGSIVSYAWTFGDGTSGSGATTSHAYTAPGTYTASLRVTDNKGASTSDAATVTVASTSSTWARAAGSTSSDAGYATAVDGSGNVIVGGAYRGTVNFGGAALTSAGGADCFVAKYSASGVLLWVRSMGGTSDDYLDAVAVDANGDVVVSARFSGTAGFGGTSLVASGSSDIAVAKYAGANGAHQWSKRFGGASDEAAAAIAVDGSGNVYFTGYFRGTIDFGGGILRVPYDTDLDVFVAKLSSAGAHVWSKNFTNDGNERGYGIAVDGSGNVAVVGYFSNTVNFGGSDLTSQNAMTDIFVARFTSAGVHSWSRRFGAPDGNEIAYGAAVDSAGNVVVTGYLMKAVDLGGGTLAALGVADAFVAKYSASSGAHVWSRRLGGVGYDYAYGVAVDRTTNEVFVTGSFDGTASFGGTTLTASGSTDAFVAKYSATGTPLWAKALGGIDGDVARAVQINAGTLAVAGYFYGTGTFEGTTLSSAGMADAFAVRLAP